jgi:hypothetical protein
MLCVPTAPPVNTSVQTSVRQPLFAAIALLATLAGCATSSPSLVVMANGGEFVETERTAQHSTVEVRKAPKGSVPSSMYALRGSCAVMRARGENYVASTTVSNSPPTFRLTFPSAPDMAQRSGPERSVFSRTECAMLGF